MKLEYEGKEYSLDIEDMDTDQARAMERFGIPNLMTLENRFAEGDVSALTVYYWLCLVQNGEPGARLDHVKFKPIKFLRALAGAQVEETDEDSGKDAAAE